MFLLKTFIHTSYSVYVYTLDRVTLFFDINDDKNQFGNKSRKNRGFLCTIFP